MDTRQVISGWPLKRTVSAVLAGVLIVAFTGGISNAFPGAWHAVAVIAPAPEVQTLNLSAAAVEVDASTTSLLARDSYTAASANNIFWPFSISTLTSGFGARAGCDIGCSTNHLGADFSVDSGTPIIAVANGTIEQVVHGSGGYGVYVTIRHDSGPVTSLYGHMLAGSPRVSAGQHVTAGDVIGSVGSTGTSTGSHLHFEVHIEDRPVDPIGWLLVNAG